MTSREQELRRALWLSALSIAWSGIAGSIAVYTALVNGSLSLLGFGADAVIDSLASAALIWRFRVETRQPERAARVETLAERVVGFALIALAISLATAAAGALAAGAHAEGSFASTVLLIASTIVLPPLAVAKYQVARRLQSGAMRGDSVLTAVAAVLALISLVSLAASTQFGLWWADAVAALVVAVIILREGLGSVAASRSAA
ncbi:MAG: cation transporter [Chloroflexi bacterium]|nr:cation transporter [Chloroflexota bacterium]